MRSKLKKKTLSANVTAKLDKMNLSEGGIVWVCWLTPTSGMNSGLTVTAIPCNSLRQDMKNHRSNHIY